MAHFLLQVYLPVEDLFQARLYRSLPTHEYGPPAFVNGPVALCYEPKVAGFDSVPQFVLRTQPITDPLAN